MCAVSSLPYIPQFALRDPQPNPTQPKMSLKSLCPTENSTENPILIPSPTVIRAISVISVQVVSVNATFSRTVERPCSCGLCQTQGSTQTIQTTDTFTQTMLTYKFLQIPGAHKTLYDYCCRLFSSQPPPSDTSIKPIGCTSSPPPDLTVKGLDIGSDGAGKIYIAISHPHWGGPIVASSFSASVTGFRNIPCFNAILERYGSA